MILSVKMQLVFARNFSAGISWNCPQKIGGKNTDVFRVMFLEDQNTKIFLSGGGCKNQLTVKSKIHSWKFKPPIFKNQSKVIKPPTK